MHGDVQGGNILIQPDGPRLVDAEIAHVGDPAFDLGSAIAQLRFHIALAPSDRPLRSTESALFDGYQLAGGGGDVLEVAYRYAGIEMMRRTIGAARPPFLQQSEPATAVLHHGVALLMGREPG